MLKTDSRIALKELPGELGLNIIRDAAIYGVGKIPSAVPARLVPCGKKSHCREILNYNDIVAVIAPPNLQDDVPDHLGLILSDNPMETLYKIHQYLCELPQFYWSDEPSIIHPNARIDKGAVIADKNVYIGANTHIKSGAVISQRVYIGENCSIGSNSVIGGHGFEITMIDGQRTEVPHIGGVRFGQNIVVQSLTNIDASAFATYTELGDNSSVDSLVHIAHDCMIGQDVTITACAEISGRVIIGDGAYLGPNCSISNGLSLGENSKVTIGSVVTRDVEAGQTVTGNFAVEHRKWLRFVKNLIKEG